MEANDPIFYVDMDGVLVDFMGGLCRVLGTSWSEVFKAWERGCYDLGPAFQQVVGAGTADVWQRLRDYGEAKFYAELELHETALETLEWLADCVGTENVMLCTSPSANPDSAKGKLQFIQEKLPSWIHRQYALCPSKHLLAGKNKVLIDDSDANCAAFKKRKGGALLVPRVWNSEYAHAARLLLTHVKNGVAYAVIESNSNVRFS